MSTGMEVVKRKRGRPRKQFVAEPRSAKLYKKFEPVTWKPIYEQMVYESCMGVPNIEIAKKFDYTPQQVSNILTCTKAKLCKQIILSTLRDEAQSSIGERLNDVADKFMRRLEHVAKDEDLFNRAPFAVVDRGLRVLAGLGHIKNPNEQQNRPAGLIINNNEGGKVAVFSNEAAGTLSEAIRKSDEARRLHGLASVEVGELPTQKAG